MEEIIKMAYYAVEPYGGWYEVFADEADVLAYIPDESELDNPVPEIWKKRIARCREIIADKEYPCIFDNENAVVVALIDEDGFKFQGKHYHVES